MAMSRCGVRNTSDEAGPFGPRMYQISPQRWQRRRRRTEDKPKDVPTDQMWEDLSVSYGRKFSEQERAKYF